MRIRHYTGFWRQGAIIHLLSATVSILLLTGCNDSGNKQETPDAPSSGQPGAHEFSLSQLVETVSERVKGASGGVPEALGPGGDVLHKMTKEEMEKIFRWEYRVVEITRPLDANDFEKRLSELGSEGWECFNISNEGTVTRVTCKRRPRGALAYLKLIPGL